MLVGLAGYAQVGKDTAAAGLKRCGFRQFAFANRLKREVTEMLRSVDIDVNLRDPEEKKRWRDLLVFWGAKRRAQDPGYWVKRLIYDIAKRGISPGIEDVVISDVRYVNEAEWIISRGGIIIRISRPGYKPQNGEEAKSFAEMDKAGFQQVKLTNHKSIAELQRRVVELVCEQEIGARCEEE